ncbi:MULTISPECIES: 6-carboxytetrahydropterin synthase [Clostridium]|uniref:6-carboxytetrahydropterin synthase n=1 Tax=Clostridium TaxID=1485 RepID=UPI00082550FE|nr:MULTISPECIES: 6-carboxytetrahydropterin synthase [Clostridium]PJI09519.1 6-pyruvoyl tetrahydrobiopterin synthase [Clostridium sp. CT7]
MKYDEYRFKFYLNASHSIYIKGVLGEEHPHTWEIIIDTIKLTSGFIIFNDVEKYIEKYMDKYQDSYINSIEPFTTLNPTLENICSYFKDDIQRLLIELGWILVSIEISETPTRSYIIDLSNRVSTKRDLMVLNSKKEDIINSSANEKLIEFEKKIG